MSPVIGLFLAYLIGSVPFAFIIGRLFGRIDLRRVGSGNLGATNLARQMGWPFFFLVFALDAAKGALPVMLLPSPGDLAQHQMWQIALGVAAIVGHTRPIFLLGHGGGKGVATAAGVFYGLLPHQTVDVLVIFGLVVLITKYVSLGSLTASGILPIMVLIGRGATPVFWFSLFIALFIGFTHRKNIQRLRKGKEPRIDRSPPKPEDDAKEPVAAGDPPADPPGGAGEV
jgi:acyl phosphate:glycerol-3-phosphate acyltransferase